MNGGFLVLHFALFGCNVCTVNIRHLILILITGEKIHKKNTSSNTIPTVPIVDVSSVPLACRKRRLNVQPEVPVSYEVCMARLRPIPALLRGRIVAEHRPNSVKDDWWIDWLIDWMIDYILFMCSDQDHLFYNEKFIAKCEKAAID